MDCVTCAAANLYRYGEPGEANMCGTEKSRGGPKGLETGEEECRRGGGSNLRLILAGGRTGEARGTKYSVRTVDAALSDCRSVAGKGDGQRAMAMRGLRATG